MLVRVSHRSLCEGLLAIDFQEALADEIEYYGSFADFFVFSPKIPGMEDTFILMHRNDWRINGMLLAQIVPIVKKLVYNVPSGELIRECVILS
jgi:hypothetical protein